MAFSKQGLVTIVACIVVCLCLFGIGKFYMYIFFKASVYFIEFYYNFNKCNLLNFQSTLRPYHARRKEVLAIQLDVSLDLVQQVGEVSFGILAAEVDNVAAFTLDPIQL